MSLAIALFSIQGLPLQLHGQDADGDLLADAVDPFPSDGFNGGWQVLPGANGTAPMLRHEGDGCLSGSQFVVLGGRETSLVEAYDPTTNVWTKGGSAPLPFHHGQAVVLNGLIYLIGAFVGPYPDETPVPDVYVYNPASKVWTKGPAIPVDRRRGAAASAVYNGRIYIAGGNTKGHRAGWVAWFDEFDPATGTWTRLADAPRPRDHHRAVVVANHLYLISGRRTSFGLSGGVLGNTIPEVDVYDFTTGVWSKLPQPIPTPRAGCAVVIHGRDVVVAAGENPTGALADVEALDVVTGTWKVFPSLKQKRNAPVGFSYGNKLFISGGQSAENASQEVLLLPPRPMPESDLITPGGPVGAALSRVLAVNSGGGAVAGFAGDANVEGGTEVVSTGAIWGAEAAPENVYKSQRTGEFRYTFTGLDPAATYRLDLHFAELTAAGTGGRTFDVLVNEELALDDFDVFAASGGRYRGTVQTFTVRLASDGELHLECKPVKGAAVLSGLSLFKASPFTAGGTGFALARPFDVLAKSGDPVAFGSVISGKAPARFQWLRNGAVVTGATSSTYRINSVNFSNAGLYSLLGNGTLASRSANLVVAGSPLFTPVVANGFRTTLRVPFAGSGVSFQWLKDNVELTDTSNVGGTRSAELVITKFSGSDAGTYSCVLRAFGETEVIGPCSVRLMQIPALSNPSPPLGSIISPYRWELSSTEVQTSFSVVGLPPGLVYDPAKRWITGTPQRSGVYNITITPRNSAGSGSPQTVAMTVEAVASAFLGSWSGLVERVSAVNGLLGGTVKATISPSGAFSGWFRNGGTAYPFSGGLRGVPGGSATLRTSIPRSGSTPLILNLTLSRTGGSATGSVAAGTAQALVSAQRATAVPANVLATTSVINCVLGLEDESQIGNASIPQGKGWMRLTRSIGGGRILITGTGRLPDGTSLNFATPECESGDVAVLSVFPSINGSLAGWGRITEVATRRHEFAGQLHWRKLRPASSTDFSYRLTGINALLRAEGITYVRPLSGETYLGLADTPANAQIAFRDGGLASASQAGELDQNFQLTTSHQALFPGAALNPAGVTMLIDVRTGIFTGAFRLKDGSVIRNAGYQGIFAGTTGEGFFNLRQLPSLSSSPVLSGSVKVSAP